MQFAVWTTNTEADSHDSTIICSVDAMRHELIEATRWVASQLDVGRNWYIKFCEGDGKKKKIFVTFAVLMEAQRPTAMTVLSVRLFCGRDAS